MPENSPRSSTAVDNFLRSAIFFLFHFLLFATPLVFTWVNEELFEFNKMLVVYFITVLVTGFWVARMVVQRQRVFRRTLFDWPILLFLASQVLSTLFSIHPQTSVFGYYTRFHGGLLSTVCYIVLFYAFVSNFERRHLPRLLFTTFSSALIVGVYAILEHFGHSFSCLLINTSQQLAGENASQVWSLANLWQSFTASCWIQDVQSRVFATFGQPNWLAAYCITLIPLGLSLLSSKTEQSIQPPSGAWRLAGELRKNLLYVVAVTALFLALLFTKSRSGILGLGVGMGIFLLGLLMTRSQTWKPTAFIVGLFAVFTLVFGTPYTPALSKFWQSNGSIANAEPVEAVNRLDVGGTASGEIRRIVWKGALQVWQRYPLLGSGVETFAYSYYKDRPMEHNSVSEWDFLYNKAHNEFLNFLATTGVLGLLSYLVLLASFIILPLSYGISPDQWYPKLRRVFSLGIKTDVNPAKQSVVDGHRVELRPRLRLQSIALAAGLVGLSVSNFFGFSTVMVGLLLFLFPAFFTVWSEEHSVLANQKEGPAWLSDHPPGSAWRQLSGRQIVGLCLIALITLFLTLTVLNTWWADRFYTIGKQYNQAGQVSQAVPYLQRAIRLSPAEGLFYDELALAYARLSLALATEKEASIAGKVAEQSLRSTDELLALNPVHLNFYKTKVRVLLTLSQLDPKVLGEAKTTLEKAIELSPTDPKLVFNLALIKGSMGELEASIQDLEKVVSMKPNYEVARMRLAELYEDTRQWEKARDQYAYILEKIQPDNLEAQLKFAQLTATASAQPNRSP